MTHQEFINKWLKYVKWSIEDDILHIQENLLLEMSKVTSLPDNLFIHGVLNLRDTEIVYLPEGLHVDSWLSVRDTKITSLPKKLFVGQEIYLFGTKIKSLPNDIYIGDTIFSYKKLSMSEKIQLHIISKDVENINIIQNPTEKAISLHNLLWKI